MKLRLVSVSRSPFPLAAAIAALSAGSDAFTVNTAWNGGGANAKWNAVGNWNSGEPTASFSAKFEALIVNTSYNLISPAGLKHHSG